VLHTLELEPDSDSVFGRFKKTRVQQSIQQAEREHVVVRRGTGRSHLNAFLRLHAMTRHRHGVPVQPSRYFHSLWEELLRRGLGFVSIAYVGSRPIAASVFLCWNATVTYKYSASDPSYWQCRPNHAVLWDAIRWGCERGYRSFDFGRTDAWNRGLRAFKSGWGSLESPLVYSIVGGSPGRDGPGVGDRVASVVIRKTPRIVCRALGELLYKHVG
jgi:lipid II:glycine glycyltransferase (peptidoglycan interpeptide bridge formation enzyme)